jgi:hypothetical protein
MPARLVRRQPGAEVTDELHAGHHGVPVAQQVMQSDSPLGHPLQPMLPFLKFASADNHCMFLGASAPPQASGTM